MRKFLIFVMINILKTSMFRGFLYMFRRFWFASTLNFVGFVASLVVLFLFVQQWDVWMNHDKCHDSWDRIFRVEFRGPIFSDDTVHIANVFAPMYTLAKRTKHVEDAGIIEMKHGSVTFNDGDGAYSIDFITCFGSHLGFWRKDIRIVRTKCPKGVLEVLIPRSFAERHFGTADVIGREFSWQQSSYRYKGRVVSVYDDFPSNCSVPNAIYSYGDGKDYDYTGNYNYYVYVRLDSADNADEVARLLKHEIMTQTDYDNSFDPANITVSLSPIDQAYFSGVDTINDKGNMAVLKIMMLLALLLTTLTSVNYVNFSLAEAPMRLRGVNTRRILGASRWKLRLELLLENVMVGLVAFVVSVALLFGYCAFSEKDYLPTNYPTALCMMLVAAIGIGLFSGWYPAYFLTRFSPANALKGTFSLSLRVRRLRVVRLIFQMECSFLIVGVIMITLIQYSYLFMSDYGFDKDQVLYGRMNNVQAMEKKPELRKAIEAIDGVESVSYSNFKLGSEDLYMWWARVAPDSSCQLVFTAIPVDWKYLRTMGIKVRSGRDFVPSDSGVFIVNQAMLDKYPWVRVGERLVPGVKQDYPVIGRCDNIRFASIRKDRNLLPMAFVIVGNDENSYFNEQSSVINIRVADDACKDEVKRRAEEAYHSVVGDHRIVLESLDQQMERLYSDEINFMRQMTWLGIIYIYLTLVGVYCNTMFETERRKKEICIRRVYGASTRRILGIFCLRYIAALLVGFVLALPAILWIQYFIMRGFVELSSWLWLGYVAALLLVSATVVGTVLFQCYSSVSVNPAQGIRNE